MRAYVLPDYYIPTATRETNKHNRVDAVKMSGKANLMIVSCSKSDPRPPNRTTNLKSSEKKAPMGHMVDFDTSERNTTPVLCESFLFFVFRALVVKTHQPSKRKLPKEKLRRALVRPDLL